MQSSALFLMSCQNALAQKKGKPAVWPLVPIYDVSVFCDLGLEPSWVLKQVQFLKRCGETLWNGRCENPDCYYHWHPKEDDEDERDA